MRIGFYTLFMTPDQIGGIETYITQLLHHLGQINSQNHYTIFVGPHNHSHFADLIFPNYHLINLPFVPPHSSWLKRLMYRWQLLPSYVQTELDRYGLDLIHYPGSTIDQLGLQTPAIVTIHDLQQEYLPHLFSPPELKRRRQSYAASAHKARHILTVSEYTRQTIISQYNISPHKITAIPHGLNPQFRYPLPPHEIERVRHQYQLPTDYFYYPAHFWPHKNHARLIEAFKLWRAQSPTKCQLVLSGVFPASLPHLSELLQTYQATDMVKVLNYLPSQALPAVYAGARGLIYPSLFEGFGLPILEAMACGCPVICSNTTSLPELVREAAILINPLDIPQIAQALDTLFHQPTVAHSLREQGLTQAQPFTWERTARQTVENYK